MWKTGLLSRNLYFVQISYLKYGFNAAFCMWNAQKNWFDRKKYAQCHFYMLEVFKKYTKMINIYMFFYLYFMLISWVMWNVDKYVDDSVAKEIPWFL